MPQSQDTNEQAIDMDAFNEAFNDSMGADVPEGDVPPGAYLARVTKADPRVGQQSGKPYIALELKILRDLNSEATNPYAYRNATLWPVLSLSPLRFPVQKLREFARAIGYSPVNGSFDYAEFRNAALDVTVKIRCRNGKDQSGGTRTEVQNYALADENDLALLTDAPQDETPF